MSSFQRAAPVGKTPAAVRGDDDVSKSVAAPVLEFGGNRFLFPDVEVLHSRKGRQDGVAAGGIPAVDAGRGAVDDALGPLLLDVAVHADAALFAEFGHSVVGQDDEVDVSGDRQAGEPPSEGSQQPVHFHDFPARFAAHGPIGMAGMVRLAEIQHHQMGALVFREGEQLGRPVDPLAEGQQPLVVRQVVRGPSASDFEVGADPVGDPGEDPLPLGRVP